MTLEASKVLNSTATKPPNAGKGRTKGTPNKTTALLKEAILKAAELVGSDGNGKGKLTGYCQFLAASEPKAFAALLGKVLPMQITGAGDGHVVVEIRRYAEPTE